MSESWTLLTPAGLVPIGCTPGEVSDGYHTFDELYQHRCLLFAALCNSYDEVQIRNATVFKTRKNDRGEEWPGWFIAGINTEFGQITYHMPDNFWDLVDSPEIERNVGYDGHTSQDVASRLNLLVRATL